MEHRHFLLPSERGRGCGTEAQRLLAAHLFVTIDVQRVQAGTGVENMAEQRALEKAGFVREDVLRSAQFRGATYHDMVSHSRIRTDSARPYGAPRDHSSSPPPGPGVATPAPLVRALYVSLYGLCRWTARCTASTLASVRRLAGPPGGGVRLHGL